MEHRSGVWEDPQSYHCAGLGPFTCGSPRARPNHRMPSTRCQWPRGTCETRMASGESGAQGWAKLCAPHSADRARVPPSSRSYHPRCDKTSSTWPSFVVKLQVNCESEAAGCLVTSSCGSKGVSPRTRKDKTMAGACPVPHADAWSACFWEGLRWAYGEAMASLGKTWLLGKRGGGGGPG